MGLMLCMLLLIDFYLRSFLIDEHVDSDLHAINESFLIFIL